MEKEVKIQVPKGYTIDEENSTFECIKFKKKDLTFTDIFNKYLNLNHDIKIACSTSAHMCKINAINNLLFVAKYLNDGWIPDFKCPYNKYYISIGWDDTLQINSSYYCNDSLAYFKSEELAQQAIDILGEDTVKIALNIYY